MATRTSPRGIVGILPYLLDIVVPLVSYYVFTSLGLSPFWALVAGGALTAATALVNTIRRGRIDSLGILVILEIALGIVLDVTFRDARLTLARGSLFILVASVWVLVNACTSRPLTVDATKPFAFRKAGVPGVIAFEWLASHSQRFLRIQRSLSVAWGATFLAYAVVRVIVVYSVAVSKAVWFTEIPGAVAIMICLAASARGGKKLEALVNQRMAETPENAARTAATEVTLVPPTGANSSAA